MKTKKEEFDNPMIDERYLDAIDRKILDIEYCNQSAAQKFDVYYPNEKSEKPYPVIVHFHGGAWLFGNKRDSNLEPVLRAVKRGYAVVSVGYRLSVEARFPALVYDGKTAIRYLRAHAKQLNIDPDKIAVWGASAGGWLASFIALTANNIAFEDLTMGYGGFSSAVDLVVDWCGPVADFTHRTAQLHAAAAVVGLKNDEGGAEKTLVWRTENEIAELQNTLIAQNIPNEPTYHDTPDSPESRLLGACITDVPHLCRLAAPTTYAAKSIPFCIVHGDSDSIVPVGQSIELANAIRACGGEAELHIAKGMPHHGNPWFTRDEVVNLCLDFVDRHLRRQ